MKVELDVYKRQHSSTTYKLKLNHGDIKATQGDTCLLYTSCSRLAELVPEGLTVHRLVPLYKDWNEVLQHRAEIADGKYIREAIYGLKEPTQEETVEIIRMSEVDTVSDTHLDVYKRQIQTYPPR